MEESPSRYLFVLIHGTWAPNSPWTRPGSLLRRTLEAEIRGLEGGELLFRRLIWTGRNRDLDRFEASQRLQTKIAALRSEYPDRHCFLIGHSHGGNIALHALIHSRNSREYVAGVVTIATPFLRFEKRAELVAIVPAALKNLIMGTLLFGPAVILATLVLMFLLHVTPWLLELKMKMLHVGASWPIWLCSAAFSRLSCTHFFAGAGATIGVISWGSLLLGVILGAWSEAKAQAQEARKQASKDATELFYCQPEELLSSTRVLALSAPVDEALQIINGAWWVHRIAGLAVGLATTVSVIAGIGGALGLFWLLVRNVELLLQQPHAELEQVVDFSLIWAAALPALCLAGACLGWLIYALARAGSSLHGRSAGQLNLYWSSRASRAPFEGSNLRKLSYSLGSIAFQGKGLLHSRLYTNGRAIRDIAEWVTRRTG